MRRFSNKLASQQSGFTLIELVIVIVIIGILAAVAIPNFADVTDDAKQSTLDGMAANYASAAAANAAVCAGNLASGSTNGCKKPTNCATANVLQTLMPGTPTKYSGKGTDAACYVTDGTKDSKQPFVFKPTA